MSLQARFHWTRGAFSLDVDLDVPGQGITALFGPSGSGKTTLLRCLAGLETVSGGQLSLAGEDWQTPDYCLPVHKRPLGYVFQEASLFPHLRVEDNLRYGYQRVKTRERRVEFAETVDWLGLGPLLSRYPDELSGGQRQRVALGRALLTSPRLLLMDEPMASLDAISRAEILPYIERLRDTLSIPVIYVSHSLEEVARLANYLVLMANGRILAQDDLQTLLVRPDLPLARSDQASAVLDTRIERHDTDYHLTELSCRAGRLWVPRVARESGETQRIRVVARDVALALSPPEQSSVSNCLPVTVLSIHEDAHPGQVLVRLAAGDQVLLSRITRRSCDRLALSPECRAYALIKGVHLD